MFRFAQHDKEHKTTIPRVAHVSLRNSKRTMDPARPNEPDPADPFNPERADHAALETIEIATEGEDCDECVRKLWPVLKRIAGVKDVLVDLKHERVIVTFDARKTHSPDLHDAILNSGYKPGPTAD
jgi:copper chaperone CopZ